MVRRPAVFGAAVKWAAWDGAGDGVIFSTRARFARSLAGESFPHMARQEELDSAGARVIEALRGSGLFSGGFISRPGLPDGAERLLLAERHHMPHMAAVSRSSVVAVSRGELLSAAVNIKTHFRAQGMAPGLDPESACAAAGRLEREVGKAVAYAASSRFGYLNPCPSDSGAGIRLSCIVHLPAMARLGGVPDALAAFARSGFTARGITGSGTCVLGDFYQITSDGAIWNGAAELCSGLRAVIGRLASGEAACRGRLFSGGMRAEAEDAVWRSYGVLRHARIMPYLEFMQHLSLLRMGAAAGCGPVADIGMLNQLALSMQPEHVRREAGLRAAAGAVLDAARAGLVGRVLA